MRSFLVMVGLAVLAGPAVADSILVEGSNQETKKACEGKDVVVQGAANKVLFTGDCAKVTVNGRGNTVALTGAVKIVVNGAKNTVTWERAVGKAKKPKVTVRGIQNKVSKGVARLASETAETGTGTDTTTPPPAGSPIAFGDNSKTVTQACGGSDVAISGNSNKITLTGDCGKVSVSGNNNSLVVDNAKEFAVAGNNNTVTYNGGVGGVLAKVSDVGKDNKIKQRR